MADVRARGCPACNAEIASAEELMPMMTGHIGPDDFWLIPAPRPHIALDGEDLTGTEVVRVVLGPDGAVLRNHRYLTTPGPHSKAHPCSCGAFSLERELLRGDVQMVPASDAAGTEP